MTYLPSIKIAGADALIVNPSDPFEISCDINGCASNCCTKSAPVILNPYELSLICRDSGTSYEDLLDILDTDRARAFPLVMLPRDPACHFWTGKGCSIYHGRPLACRLYPLGRVFEQGRSHLVHPSLNVCSGIVSSPSRTVGDYLLSQNTETHIRMADRLDSIRRSHGGAAASRHAGHVRRFSYARIQPGHSARARDWLTHPFLWKTASCSVSIPPGNSFPVSSTGRNLLF